VTPAKPVFKNDVCEGFMKFGFKVATLATLLLIFAGAWLHWLGNAHAASHSQITGTVKLEGVAPRQRTIDMASEPSCAALHKDKPVTAESVVVGPNGGLANVVLYVSQGLTGKEAPSSVPVQIEQRGCQYLPHVVAVDVGQPMKILNSDHALHNVHPQTASNSEWNKSQLVGGAPFDVTWTKEEVAIPIKCNIHPWMKGYIAVVKGPYAVTDGSGSFKLENVPPGSYTLTAWQEFYGTKTQDVTVTAGKPASVSFTFQAR